MAPPGKGRSGSRTLHTNTSFDCLIKKMSLKTLSVKKSGSLRPESKIRKKKNSEGMRTHNMNFLNPIFLETTFFRPGVEEISTINEANNLNFLHAC